MRKYRERDWMRPHRRKIIIKYILKKRGKKGETPSLQNKKKKIQFATPRPSSIVNIGFSLHLELGSAFGGAQGELYGGGRGCVQHPTDDSSYCIIAGKIDREISWLCSSCPVATFLRLLHCQSSTVYLTSTYYWITRLIFTVVETRIASRTDIVSC